jgi:tripartite-type tricarboxylate transporter receptor subunit TctC
LKALAVGSAKRHPDRARFSDAAGARRQGADVDVWYAFLAPKRHASAGDLEARARIARDPRVARYQGDFRQPGHGRRSSTPAELAALMRREDTRWAAIVRKNNITAE